MATSGSRPRLFMLEDDLMVVQLVETLAQMEGWEFATASLVAGAVDAARRFRPDLMLVDVNLPDGEGYAFCSAARADPELSDVPAIFLTSREDTASRLKGFASGAQDYVAKPFDLQEVAARIRAHLKLKRQRDDLASDRAAMLLRERVRRDMVDMIVHDLRAPLAMIQGTLTMVLEAGLIRQDEYKEMLRRAGTASDFAILLIGDILDVDAASIRAQPAPLDFFQLMTRLKTLFWVAGRDRKLVIRESGRFPAARTDGTLLFRVLVNLVQNALKFNRGTEPVELSIAPGAERLRVEVLDRGPGVPAADKEKIFEMGYRADADSRVAGHGVGLAFCRLAARALGGRIWAEDRPGGGSVFVLEIPV